MATAGASRTRAAAPSPAASLAVIRFRMSPPLSVLAASRRADQRPGVVWGERAQVALGRGGALAQPSGLAGDDLFEHLPRVPAVAERLVPRHPVEVSPDDRDRLVLALVTRGGGVLAED